MKQKKQIKQHGLQGCGCIYCILNVVHGITNQYYIMILIFIQANVVIDLFCANQYSATPRAAGSQTTIPDNLPRAAATTLVVRLRGNHPVCTGTANSY